MHKAKKGNQIGGASVLKKLLFTVLFFSIAARARNNPDFYSIVDLHPRSPDSLTIEADRLRRTHIKPNRISSGSPSGNLTLGGQNSANFYNVNNVQVIDGNKYGCSAAGLNAAIAALPTNGSAPGGTVDARFCQNNLRINSTVTLGVNVNQAVTLLLPAALISCANTSGACFEVNGIGSHLHGMGPIATVIAPSPGYTGGTIVKVEPPSGSSAITYVEVDGFRIDVGAASSTTPIEALSTRNPTTIHNIDVRNFTGRAMNITTQYSSGTACGNQTYLNGALIPQGTHVFDTYFQAASSTITDHAICITGNQIQWGPNSIVIFPPGSSESGGPFHPLILTPTNTSQGDGRGNLIFGSAFYCNGISGAVGVFVTTQSSSASGALSNTIGPGNTFENCQTGYEFTGLPGKQATANAGLFNFFDPGTANLLKIDFGLDNTILEAKTNGNAADITLTANSAQNTVQVHIANTTDISDSGTSNSIETRANNRGSNNFQIKGEVSANNFQSASANPATSGVILLGNQDNIAWKNAANNGNDFLFRNRDVLTDQVGGINHIIAETNVANNWTVGQVAAGTAATLLGTGACATITTQVGGSWSGSFECSGTTGASTVTITPGSTAPNGWSCSSSDITAGVAGAQSASTTTTCQIKFTRVTANDVLTFTANAF